MASRWSLQRTADGGPQAMLALNTNTTLHEALRAAEQCAAAARLEGILLAAREVADLVNNDLTPVVAALALFPDELRPEVLATCQPLLDGARTRLDSALHHLRPLGHVERVAVKQTPMGPALDLERSARPLPGSATSDAPGAPPATGEHSAAPRG